MKILLEGSCCRIWQDRRTTPGNWLHVAGVINNLTQTFPEVKKDREERVLHLEAPLTTRDILEKIAKIKGVFHIELNASEALQLSELRRAS